MITAMYKVKAPIHSTVGGSAMKDRIITREETDLNLIDEFSSFGLRLGGICCAVIGIWAFTCLAAALFKFGSAEVLRGYITAVTGM